ncbi:hypothetical protein D4764_22G0005910 [Takifugu flavidus]|uniref:Uncharacterized protein n=1 Tax=Takifugu flavidus TaxID=433684 RepID=A0A5C6NBW2_9TELE|nr:hypothetical protein D4764_22G0005910 [Takifugu flavidus]
MEHFQNENLTRGLTEPEVTHWDSTAQQTSVNIIVVLGVLTFGLQLCLVLFFMSRCQRLDKRIRDALKQPKAASKHTTLSSVHGNMYKQANYQQCNKDSSSPAVSEVSDQAINSNLFGPSIPWDLIQS